MFSITCFDLLRYLLILLHWPQLHRQLSKFLLELYYYYYTSIASMKINTTAIVTLASIFGAASAEVVLVVHSNSAKSEKNSAKSGKATGAPSLQPSSKPSSSTSTKPSSSPSFHPTLTPSVSPSMMPSTKSAKAYSRSTVFADPIVTEAIEVVVVGHSNSAKSGKSMPPSMAPSSCLHPRLPLFQVVSLHLRLV